MEETRNQGEQYESIVVSHVRNNTGFDSGGSGGGSGKWSDL